MDEGLKTKPDSYWKDKLNPEQYNVLRENGTEVPFTGDYWNHTGEGTYRCAACGAPLFASDDKFDAGSGWPSFFKPTDQAQVEMKDDMSLGFKRTEVRCSNCGSHLGHVFDDGPEEYKGKERTGQRFCINSCALDFKGEEGKNETGTASH